MANDITLQIAAQDQATAILEKIARSTEKLQASMQTAAQKSEESGSKITMALKGFAVAAAGLAAAKAAISGVTSAISGMEASVNAFNIQEEAARNMTQAQLDFAASLQVATNVGDEATLALMRYAEAAGMSKQQSQEAVTVAVGLAKAFGISQQDALKKVMQATAGNADAMARLIPEIRNATTEQEKLDLITKASANGMRMLEENAQTTAGAMARSAGAFGDLQEVIGALFAPLYRVVHQGLAVFAETMQGALKPSVDMVTAAFKNAEPMLNLFGEAMQSVGVIVGSSVEAIISVVGSMVDAVFGGFGSSMSTVDLFAKTIDNVSRYVIGAITFLEVVFSNFGTVVDIAISYVLLKLEELRADMVHLFTQVLPEYVTWFGRNFTNIISDAFNAAATVMKNFASMVGKFWATIYEFFKGGMEGGLEKLASDVGDVMGRNLMEGFAATTEALPEIAARQMTATEKALNNRMMHLGNGLATEFTRKYDERVARLEKPINAEMNIEMPNLEAAASKAMEEKAKDIIDDVKSQTTKPAELLQANTSRLLTRGPQEDPLMKRSVELQQQQLIAINMQPAKFAEELRQTMPVEPPLTVELVA